MHKTKQGETWDLISIAEYDTPYCVENLIAANPKYSDVLIFDADVELAVPDVPESEAATLPPWKRGTRI